MRFLASSISAVVGAMVIAVPAQAQWSYGGNSYQRELRQVQRECNRELRRADTRREFRQAQRDCQRDLAQLQRRFGSEYYDDGRNWNDDPRFSRNDPRWDGRRERDDDDDDDDD